MDLPSLIVVMASAILAHLQAALESEGWVHPIRPGALFDEATIALKAGPRLARLPDGATKTCLLRMWCEIEQGADPARGALECCGKLNAKHSQYGKQSQYEQMENETAVPIDFARSTSAKNAKHSISIHPYQDRHGSSDRREDQDPS